jgi:hypothetical protein
MMHALVRSYQATAKGSAFRAVTCENCRAEYVYHLTRRVQGISTGSVFAGTIPSWEAAVGRANAELNRTLATEHDTVPCPSCGWYQQPMIAVLRRNHQPWMFLTGTFLLFSTALLLGLFVLALTSVDPPASTVRLLLLRGAACTGVVGHGLILARNLIANRLQPNDGEPDVRKRLGQQLAKTKDEFDRLMAASAKTTSTQHVDPSPPHVSNGQP